MLKVLGAYERLEINGELESRKFTSSVTDTVYKIEIDEQPYVLKITKRITKQESESESEKGPAIYHSLVNEENIYTFLSKQPK